MLPDRVSNPGPLTYESGALPIALRGPADKKEADTFLKSDKFLHKINTISFSASPSSHTISTSGKMESQAWFLFTNMLFKPTRVI